MKMNPLPVLTHGSSVIIQQHGQLSHPLTSRLLESNNESVGRKVAAEVRRISGEAWMGNHHTIAESFLYVNKGKQFAASGISKPADLL